MAIIKTLTITQVADALLQDDYASLSYEGALALANYLEEYSNDIGQDIELDVVAIRYEFTEYALEDVGDAYPDVFADFGEVEKEDVNLVIETLKDYTTVLKVNDDTIILADF